MLTDFFNIDFFNGEYDLKYTSPFTEDEARAFALELLISGEPAMVSTGICDSITYGYGYLDKNGYWEFPIYPMRGTYDVR